MRNFDTVFGKYVTAVEPHSCVFVKGDAVGFVLINALGHNVGKVIVTIEVCLSRIEVVVHGNNDVAACKIGQSFAVDKNHVGRVVGVASDYRRQRFVKFRFVHCGNLCAYAVVCVVVVEHRVDLFKVLVVGCAYNGPDFEVYIVEQRVAVVVKLDVEVAEVGLILRFAGKQCRKTKYADKHRTDYLRQFFHNVPPRISISPRAKSLSELIVITILSVVTGCVRQTVKAVWG